MCRAVADAAEEAEAAGLVGADALRGEGTETFRATLVEATRGDGTEIFRRPAGADCGSGGTMPCDRHGGTGCENLIAGALAAAWLRSASAADWPCATYERLTTGNLASEVRCCCCRASSAPLVTDMAVGADANGSVATVVTAAVRTPSSFLVASFLAFSLRMTRHTCARKKWKAHERRAR